MTNEPTTDDEVVDEQAEEDELFDAIREGVPDPINMLAVLRSELGAAKGTHRMRTMSVSALRFTPMLSIEIH